MRARPTVVEILGLPGSGKTTVAQQLAVGGISTMTSWTALPHPCRSPTSVYLILRAPLLSILVYLTVATRRRARAVHLRRVLSVLRRHVIVKAQRASGVLVLDEGPVHALFVTLYGTRSTVVSRVLMRGVLALLGRQLDRFVHLEVPRERCIENFRRPGRSSARFNSTSSASTVEEFRSDGTYDEILHALREVAGARLVVVDSVAGACEAAREVPVMPASRLPQDAA